jgi:hypothetical protein
MDSDMRKGASLSAGAPSAMPAPGFLLLKGHGHGHTGHGTDTGGINRPMNGSAIHLLDKFSGSASG